MHSSPYNNRSCTAHTLPAESLVRLASVGTLPWRPGSKTYHSTLSCNALRCEAKLLNTLGLSDLQYISLQPLPHFPILSTTSFIPRTSLTSAVCYVTPCIYESVDPSFLDARDPFIPIRVVTEKARTKVQRREFKPLHACPCSFRLARS